MQPEYGLSNFGQQQDQDRLRQIDESRQSQAQMTGESSNTPMIGQGVNKTALGVGLGILPVLAQKDPGAVGNATGMWGSLVKLVGG